MTEILNTSKAPLAIGPYVQGVNLGELVFTSGQLPIDPNTKAMSEDIAEQTLQSLTNALEIIQEAGLAAKNIVKTTVFLKDLNDFPIVNQVYGEFFETHNSPFPARSCIEVSRLPMDAKVEIEVIAVK